MRFVHAWEIIYACDNKYKLCRLAYDIDIDDGNKMLVASACISDEVIFILEANFLFSCKYNKFRRSSKWKKKSARYHFAFSWTEFFCVCDRTSRYKMNDHGSSSSFCKFMNVSNDNFAIVNSCWNAAQEFYKCDFT